MTERGARPLRVGLIGAGAIADRHLRAYLEHRDRVELVAVCDVVEERARKVAAQAGAARVYTDALELLRDAPIDAVDICTIHDQHASLAIAAAESGRHVLVEKPMACSLADCQAMVDAADRAGVTLMVAQVMRFVPSYRAAREAIAAGAIGPVRALRIDLMMDLRDAFPVGHWNFDGARAGGGVVIMGGVHILDLMRYVVGEVASVSATCWTTRPDRFLNGSEDYAMATLSYENGAVGALFASFSAMSPPWGWRFIILGDEGTVATVPSNGWLGFAAISSPDPSGAASVTTPVPLGDGAETHDIGQSFVDEILHFAECCQSGAEPLTSGRDNLGTMRQIFGIYEAARTGGTVELATL